MKTNIMLLCLVFLLGSFNLMANIENMTHKGDELDTPASHQIEDEYNYVIERNGGKEAIAKFRQFLERNFGGAQQFELTSNVKGNTIRKLMLRIKSESGINIIIQSNGFNRFELSWKLKPNREASEIWYRFDDREKKAINVEDNIGRRQVKVKFKSV